MRGEINSVIYNEQLKLSATAFNNIGVAAIVTGVIVPLVAHVSLNATPNSRYWGWFVALWLSFGLSLHVTGRQLLRGLRT